MSYCGKNNEKTEQKEREYEQENKQKKQRIFISRVNYRNCNYGHFSRGIGTTKKKVNKKK